MATPQITAASEDEADRICAELGAINHQHGVALKAPPIRLAARDRTGAVVGGFVGEVHMGWLASEALWVAEPARRAGIGSRLLAEAETIAVSLGAGAVYLETFSKQAEAFYASHGYAVFGRLEDFADGAARVFMKKRLAPADSRRV